MKKISIITFIFLTFWACNTQNNVQKHIEKLDKNTDNRYLRIVSYNLENYFDPFNDSLTNDEEFTPEGMRHWTWDKYKDKRNKIYKVLTAVGGWELPDIVGLYEVENEFVLRDLLKSTPLTWRTYEIVHKESPDRRGIDVAMLYRTDKIKLICKQFIEVVFPSDTSKKTRDILYAKCFTNDNDTLNIFINHWPSRYGGQAQSEMNRQNVAKILRLKIDSIFASNQMSNIIIIGDFNDEPDNVSITDFLKAVHNYDSLVPGKIYNLAWYMKEKKGMGSLKFQGEWGLIDQIMVSSSMLMKNNSIYTTLDNAKVYKADFLTEPDDAFIGDKPFRTFIGFKYHGGFSDHYPIYLDLFHQ
ncbi:MAG: endonuclease [Bacteroidetes bacterium CG23_combo_of_CG06-09_8_20_14_all_32_9]|nr:MAG: endonuclease [Bacteroidetes bacterium CG23_combo_of_CG06-09_8_20_14_all_32_9]